MPVLFKTTLQKIYRKFYGNLLAAELPAIYRKIYSNKKFTVILNTVSYRKFYGKAFFTVNVYTSSYRNFYNNDDLP